MDNQTSYGSGGAHIKFTFRDKVQSNLTNKVCIAIKSSIDLLDPQQQNKSDDIPSSDTIQTTMDTTSAALDDPIIELSSHPPSCNGSENDLYLTKSLELSLKEHNLLVKCVTRDKK